LRRIWLLSCPAVRSNGHTRQISVPDKPTIVLDRWSVMARILFSSAGGFTQSANLRPEPKEVAVHLYPREKKTRCGGYNTT
jgi:hypothetical protein